MKKIFIRKAVIIYAIVSSVISWTPIIKEFCLEAKYSREAISELGEEVVEELVETTAKQVVNIAGCMSVLYSMCMPCLKYAYDRKEGESKTLTFQVVYDKI